MRRLPVVLILAACSAADGAVNCQQPPLEGTDRLSTGTYRISDQATSGMA